MHAILTFNVRDAEQCVQQAWAQHERRHAESREQRQTEFGDLFVGLQWQTPNSPVLLLMCLCVCESTNVWSQYLLDHSLLGAISPRMLLTIMYVCLDSHLGILSRDLVQ